MGGGGEDTGDAGTLLLVSGGLYALGDRNVVPMLGQHLLVWQVLWVALYLELKESKRGVERID